MTPRDKAVVWGDRMQQSIMTLEAVLDKGIALATAEGATTVVTKLQAAKDKALECHVKLNNAADAVGTFFSEAALNFSGGDDKPV